MTGTVPTSVIRRTRILDLLALLFLGRVLGQLGVYLGILPFLPPMDQWQSGALRYPVLLSWQVAILFVMLLVRKRLLSKGHLVSRSVASYLKPTTRIFAAFYAAIMSIRLLVWKWGELHDFPFFGVWIPPVFHLVLAGYLFALASSLSSNDTGHTKES